MCRSARFETEKAAKMAMSDVTRVAEVLLSHTVMVAEVERRWGVGVVGEVQNTDLDEFH